jgi:hypothetical protein
MCINYCNALKFSCIEIKSKKFLFERISLAIQRGNAASIRGTFPDSALLSEIHNKIFSAGISLSGLVLDLINLLHSPYYLSSFLQNIHFFFFYSVYILSIVFYFFLI